MSEWVVCSKCDGGVVTMKITARLKKYGLNALGVKVTEGFEE